jgi:hypothetical protein
MTTVGLRTAQQSRAQGPGQLNTHITAPAIGYAVVFVNVRNLTHFQYLRAVLLFVHANSPCQATGRAKPDEMTSRPHPPGRPGTTLQQQAASVPQTAHACSMQSTHGSDWNPPGACTGGPMQHSIKFGIPPMQQGNHGLMVGASVPRRPSFQHTAPPPLLVRQQGSKAAPPQERCLKSTGGEAGAYVNSIRPSRKWCSPQVVRGRSHRKM